MSLNDPIANMLSKIVNAEKVGKSVVHIRSSSKLMKGVLKILQDRKYVGKIDEADDGKGNALTIQLLGQINKAGAVKPRHAIGLDTYTKFEKRYLLAKDFGVLIVSTSKGLMTHLESKEQKMGGKLIAYCY